MSHDKKDEVKLTTRTPKGTAWLPDAYVYTLSKSKVLSVARLVSLQTRTKARVILLFFVHLFSFLLPCSSRAKQK